MEVATKDGQPVEAFQYTGEFNKVLVWANDLRYFEGLGMATDGAVTVQYGEDTLRVYPGDWLVYDGETMDVCRQRDFKQFYTTNQEVT